MRLHDHLLHLLRIHDRYVVNQIILKLDHILTVLQSSSHLTWRPLHHHLLHPLLLPQPQQQAVLQRSQLTTLPCSQLLEPTQFQPRPLRLLHRSSLIAHQLLPLTQLELTPRLSKLLPSPRLAWFMFAHSPLKHLSQPSPPQP